jgi:quinol monooxygenase YgiN
LIAKPGEEDALRKCCDAVLVPTRKEKGCVQYDCGQSLDNPREFFFLEIWDDMEALKAHTTTEHMAVFSPLAESLSESQVIDAHFVEKTRRLKPRPETAS